MIWHYSEVDQNGDGKIEFEEEMHRSCGTVAIQDGLLFIADFSGLLHCLDPKTGKVLKQGRLPDAVDDYYSSPVGADGKGYMASQNGKVSVLKAAGDWPVLATNDFGEEIYATPAVSDGRIYLRTMGALYLKDLADKTRRGLRGRGRAVGARG